MNCQKPFKMIQLWKIAPGGIMKIRTYFPRFYFVFLFVLAVVYTILAYVFLKMGIYPGIFIPLLVFIFICYISWIHLYDDGIFIFQFYQIGKIKFEQVEKIEIGEYRNSPVIYFQMKNGKRKKFFYKTYAKQTSIEIIEAAFKKNNMIELDAQIKKLMDGTKVYI